MAKRSSILQRSKIAENRVSKYLWGEEHYRNWEQRHDVSGVDSFGSEWYGEVKNCQWPSGPKALWSILYNALKQVQGVTEENARCFSVFIPVSISIESALVMYWVEDLTTIIEPLRQFKDKYFTR